jgi:hypothetical protein
MVYSSLGVETDEIRIGWSWRVCCGVLGSEWKIEEIRHFTLLFVGLCVRACARADISLSPSSLLTLDGNLHQ